MQKLQKALSIAVIASETSHVFCCVLPTIFSILSLMAGLGMIVAVPGWLEGMHTWLHAWELPMIIASGVVLVLGWGVYRYSKKVDCHDSGCGHGPCAPKKDRANLILKIATGLFLVNITVYAVFHQGMQVFTPAPEKIQASHNH